MVKEREAHCIYFFQGTQNGKCSLSLGLSLLLPASNAVLEPLSVHFGVAAQFSPLLLLPNYPWTLLAKLPLPIIEKLE